MQESSKQVVLEILNRTKPKEILDAPSGNGWLGERLGYDAVVDGVDLFETKHPNYRNHLVHDLDFGLPDHLPKYDAVISCEGIEHFGNPDLFFKSAKERLKPGGIVMITTPSVWYPEARLQYWLRGFFPGFPCLVGRIKRGTHMHIMPWSYPHLYLYLKLNDFKEIELHEEPLSRPKYWYEKVLSLPQKLYCKSKVKKTQGEEKAFWEASLSPPSLYGRHLIVTARV